MTVRPRELEVVLSGEAFQTALCDAARAIGAPADFQPQVERPRDASHGSFATNAALVLTKRLGRPPRQLAEELIEALDTELAGGRVEIAGPGFINLSLADAWIHWGLSTVLDADLDFGRSTAPRPERTNVEFVSANPTGPIHVAHGRGTAIGDVVASLLTWTGHDVTREFYLNDTGRQIELLGESVDVRYRQARGDDVEIPPNGYHGDYVRELAEQIAARHPETLEPMPDGQRIGLFSKEASEILLEEQKADLADFGVHMDLFRHESDLYADGEVAGTLQRFEDADLTYADEGAVWLRTTRFGDEKDRVLVKGDGSFTYFLPDVAYHVDKHRRGFERAIDVWGADHHGHIPRMQAAMQALGLGPDFLETLIMQLVTVTRGGVEVRMSKRAGEFVTLRELYEETGVDVARYFFLMRRAEAAMSFDLDLALDTSENNPVYKVQYAHARMCSVFARGGIDRASIDTRPDDFAGLTSRWEIDVAGHVLRFPFVVRGAAAARAPYMVCAYLEEMAGAVNAWYHQGNVDAELRVLAEGPSREARLGLARAVQITLRNGLNVLGVSAPERMEREETSE